LPAFIHILYLKAPLSARILTTACYSANACFLAHKSSVLVFPRPNFHSTQDSDPPLLMQSSVALKLTISILFMGENLVAITGGPTNK